ncbi:hypothetical protein GE118_03290 [Mycoplasma sp. NEAQ87857]|uniref:hypothetical protein n=1 Tax=Mycoplasma sp. NEAQ87857 TaxID=2683967 RepID=UPI001318E79A|nr:hypothetical protein [Mycoplasma sp. NEAQ87857]QGZ97814.1 hypothetical protein GE118_03290 [Mycoplasma sp. NEAQ87857]
MLKKSEYFKFQTKEELWSHEKETFRFWVFSFLITLVIILGLYIAQIVLLSLAISNNVNNITVSPLLTTSFIVIIGCALLFSYSKSLIKSYKEKDFRFLSQYTLSFVSLFAFIGIFMLLFSLFGLAGFENIKSTNSYNKAAFIINAISIAFVILTWFVVGREVKVIRQAFFAFELRKQMEKVKEEYLKILKNANINFDNQATNNTNPFTGFNFNQTQDNTTNTENKVEENTNKNQELKKLLNLPNAQLFEIAKKLNIFGYETMTKEELAETIYNYTNIKNK